MKNYNLKNGLLAALLLASPMVGAETDYPAADFQPEIVYQDDDYIGKPEPSSAAGASQAESKYPAADFQPEVIFQDADQIANVGATAAAAAGSAAAPSGSAEPGAEEAAPPLMENYWVGLVGLGLAGFAVLYGRQSRKPEVSSEPPASTGDASGLTGVARYLRTHDMDGSTGVQKYLEKQAQEFTGVERYLRQRG